MRMTYKTEVVIYYFIIGKLVYMTTTFSVGGNNYKENILSKYGMKTKYEC